MHNHYLHEKLAAFVIPARDAGIQKKRRMDPSVKHWDDTFMFEAKPAIAFNTLPSQNVRTVVRYVLE
ncbi:hypothetical protein [Wolbachia endosymbiont (group A) of Icerya purchasi]|uniref:hypothetical protein n=1 Tax=Wolbachia endosymbiont (group A) of Icerya purchasi TaxID=2954019 RepID=UPI003877A373